MNLWDELMFFAPLGAAVLVLVILFLLFYLYERGKDAYYTEAREWRRIQKYSFYGERVRHPENYKKAAENGYRVVRWSSADMCLNDSIYIDNATGLMKPGAKLPVGVSIEKDITGKAAIGGKIRDRRQQSFG